MQQLLIVVLLETAFEAADIIYVYGTEPKDNAMKAIMVMYDSLNRHMLPNHGCDWTLAPNFARLAERAVTFDNHYVGSMPCMPARREMHTGRYNFLHRSWGPHEPFDDSTFVEMKKTTSTRTWS